MKSIKFIIANLVLIVLHSCLDISHDTRDIKIYNKSNSVVYCLDSDSDYFTYPYINQKKSGIENLNQIKVDSFIIYPENPKNWDEYIKSAKNGKVRLFFISKDSIDKYGWDKVLINNIYTKVYKLDIDDLKKCNWEITYDMK